jgi:2-polyprenyl-6-methoxyphenol hydroxylase-like FAD-dependent oxidoreductase
VKAHLVVAGGGIGGTAAALALHRAGFGVTLFERAPVVKEAGAGISLWPNATRILASWGLLDEIVAAGREVTQFNLQTPNGRFISTIPMSGFTTPSLCLRRADLHRALLRQLPPACVVMAQRVERFSHAPKGIKVSLAGGTEILADGLIGADGIHSAVREQLHGPARPSYRGYCIWRGLAPEIPGGIPGHISETWGRGRRFGIMPVRDGQVCWYATHNRPSAKADSAEAQKAEILALFAAWHHPVGALVLGTPAGEIIRSDAQDRRALHHWGEERVTLLGDAAHPVTPNVGQGACMAIEDAACLAKCLRLHSSVPSAFRHYESRRQPRTAFIARRARHIGVIGQWEHPLLTGFRNLATSALLARSPDLQLNAMYAYEV